MDLENVPTHNGISVSYKEEWNYNTCRKNEIRTKLELIILQRIRQTQKDKHFLLYVKCRPKFIYACTHTQTYINKYTGPESIKGRIRDRKRLKGKEWQAAESVVEYMWHGCRRRDYLGGGRGPSRDKGRQGWEGLVRGMWKLWEAILLSLLSDLQWRLSLSEISVYIKGQ